MDKVACLDTLEWLRNSRVPPPCSASVWGAGGSPALAWPHRDSFILDSLGLSHCLDIKAPPGRLMPRLGGTGLPGDLVSSTSIIHI